VPNFEVFFNAGVTPTLWDDPALGSLPSRVNPNPTAAHKYFKATLGVQVQLAALVGGSFLTDTSLGGELFSSYLAENPGYPIIPAWTPGTTALQFFTPQALGHHLWVMTRTNGGAIAVHLDVE
jgi:hypothetical protein